VTDLIFATYDLNVGLAAARPAAPAPAGGRLYIYQATDTGDISIWNGAAWVVVGGPVGPAGPVGPMGFTLDPDDPIEAMIVPGAAGPQGAASVVPGPQGPPGLALVVDAEEPLEPLMVPGPGGPQGPAGATGFPGLDADEPAEPLMISGPQGIAGTTGLLGPPGQDADEPVEPIMLPGPAGPSGPSGADGPPGFDADELAEPPPIPGPQGQGFTSQGAWSPTGTYNPFDVVTYGGSTWLCYSAVQSSAISPDRDTSHFALWAAKGAAGTPDPTLLPVPFSPLPLELASDLTFDLMLTGLY
jgi:hypothetical protein